MNDPCANCADTGQVKIGDAVTVCACVTPLRETMNRHREEVEALKALHRLSDTEANYLADLMMQEGRDTVA